MTDGLTRDAAALRRLTVLVGAAVLIDTTFYAVVAPLLPGLSHSLHLSKLGAGVLTASYPAGMLVASVPGGLLAVRTSPRLTICVGLSLLVVSTVAFALLRSAPSLDLARFIEGIGGACSWAAGVAWLMQVAPSDRRGTVIGRAVSSAIVGTVAGPGVGAIASAIGRPALFSALAALALGLVIVTWRLRVPHTPTADAASTPTAHGATPTAHGATPTAHGATPTGTAAAWALLRRPLGVWALWLMVLPAMVSGTLTVLGPLALHPLGAGAGLIGGAFIFTACLEGAVSTWVGGVSDRHGRLPPLVGALSVAGIAIGCFGAASDVPWLIVVIAVTGGGLGAAWTPVMALFSDLSDAVGLDQALGAGLMNMAWAGGQIIGSGGSGALAHATNDTVTTLILAALCLLSVGVLVRTRSSVGAGEPVNGEPVNGELGSGELGSGEPVNG